MASEIDLPPSRLDDMPRSDESVRRADIARFPDARPAGPPVSALVLGIACGAAIGAALALVFAPKTGRDLRRQVADAANDLGRKMHDAGDTMADMIARGRRAVDAGRKAYGRPANGPAADMPRL